MNERSLRERWDAYCKRYKIDEPTAKEAKGYPVPTLIVEFDMGSMSANFESPEHVDTTFAAFGLKIFDNSAQGAVGRMILQLADES